MAATQAVADGLGRAVPPGPPPALTSAQWARDYNEVQSLGGKASKQRSAEQTEAARFWDYSLPAVYHGVVRSVATRPGATSCATRACSPRWRNRWTTR